MKRATTMAMSPPVSILVLIAFASIAICCIASTAVAEEGAGGDAPDYTTPGFYLYAGGVVAVDLAAADELNALIGIPDVVSVDTALGFNARAGARGGRWFAGEAQVEYVPSFDVTAVGLTFASYDMVVVTGNLKLFLLDGRVQPFAVLGFGGAFADLDLSFVPAPAFAGASVSASGFALRGGGGLEIHATEHVGLVVDVTYVYPTGDVADLDYLSIGWGLQYKF